jgi:NADPH:quinone reductase-like Zn-dependent oxidoreductase
MALDIPVLSRRIAASEKAKHSLSALPQPWWVWPVFLYDDFTNIALQLVRLLGFSPIIATAATKHEALLKKYGATHVVDRSQPVETQAEKIRSIAPSLEAAVNAVGLPDTDAVIAASLASGGRFISTLDVSEEVLSKHPDISGKMIIGVPMMHPESATQAGVHLTEALKSGKFLPLPYKVYGGLEKTADALQAVKKASGYKVLVHPQE